MSGSNMGSKQMTVGGSSLAEWLIQSFTRLQGRGRTPRKRLQVIETLPMQGRGYLTLVRCGGGEFLVGGGTNSIEVIVRVKPSDSTSAAGHGEEL